MLLLRFVIVTGGELERPHSEEVPSGESHRRDPSGKVAGVAGGHGTPKVRIEEITVTTDSPSYNLAEVTLADAIVAATDATLTLVQTIPENFRRSEYLGKAELGRHQRLPLLAKPRRGTLKEQ